MASDAHNEGAHLCPNGCGQLIPLHVLLVSLARCPICAGIFADKAGQAALRKMLAQDVDRIEGFVQPANTLVAIHSRESTEPKKCPECQTLMTPHYIPEADVTVDRCPMCGGLWADDQELAAAVRALDELSDTQYSAKLPASVRDEMTKAIADELKLLGDMPQKNHVEGATALPTIADWIHRADRDRRPDA